MRSGLVSALVFVLGLAWAPAPGARAVTLTLQAESTPSPGITVRRYRAASPAADVHVASVQLCQAHVHVEATRAPSALRAVGAWGAAEGVQVATNGDFYKAGPVRVYGQAVGRGIPWPLAQTGADPQYSWEWFYRRHGWIGFGHDQVHFSHTEAVKLAGGVSSGWRPGEVTTELPPGVLSLVSGFPELVVDGQQVTCTSPTDAACFPDRSDMRARHPRTAMGLTEDRQTLLLVVVDGRTASHAGMYGAELAQVMKDLGAWVAFNLDGGGSSQLWVEGSGTINAYDGNNLGNGARAVGNHWGIAAGAASGRPARPGSCVTQPPCAVLGPSGGVLDDAGPCFRAFGPAQYWRTEGVGHDGGLRWTNAWDTALPSNWAWWQVHLAAAGEYRVEVYADPAFALYDAAHYRVVAAGAEYELTVDQSQIDGWHAIGTFQFDAGGGQHVAVFDDAPGPVASGQHVTADAVRLTRVDAWCGDGACAASEGCEGCPEDCGDCPPPEPDPDPEPPPEPTPEEAADVGTGSEPDVAPEVIEDVGADPSGAAEDGEIGPGAEKDAGPDPAPLPGTEPGLEVGGDPDSAIAEGPGPGGRDGVADPSPASTARVGWSDASSQVGAWRVRPADPGCAGGGHGSGGHGLAWIVLIGAAVGRSRRRSRR